MKIDWKKVWKDFDEWWWNNFTTEKKERVKIQSLVESQLRKKVKRRKK